MMPRKLLVLPVLLALVLLGTGACGSKAHHASDTSGVTTASPGGGEQSPGGTGPGGAQSPGGTASPAVCPTESTKKFAKTRFVADAGLAFGAFHRWIYKPWQAGSFKSGAQNRKKTIVKAAAAGAFVVNRLNAGRKLVNADPTLCKTLKQPLDSLWNHLSGLTGKLKSGNVDPNEIGSVGGAVEKFRQEAAQQGANIKDKTPPNV
ncbi:hypothetical protein DZF91_04015 [Actinomadura logoneensis]|uniref:Uncharacterized protein n=1 Tax=Actinomadura logoneensis TaxID=2293572 RepID=A0A372JSJ1_9ACTN|nr:hypothetical protein [Actinomadura logoneensis]RFU42910.1 hypothetical protein DZF91_04015 [Actinomadura logoneensis]